MTKHRAIIDRVLNVATNVRTQHYDDDTIGNPLHALMMAQCEVAIRKREDWAVGTAKLGGYSPREFLELCEEQQMFFYKQALVKPCKPIYIGWSPCPVGDDPNWQIRNNHQLRRLEYMSDAEAGRAVVEKAQEVYHGENEFVVDSDHLHDFLHDIQPNVEGGGEPIGHLVRKITVRIRLGRRTKANPNMEHLNLLRGCTNAAKICLQIRATGMTNGADMDTQKFILDIAQLVATLKAQSTDVQIEKVLLSPKAKELGPPVDLTRYWDGSDAVLKKKVRAGTDSFEDYIRVLVAKLVLPSKAIDSALAVSEATGDYEEVTIPDEVGETAER